MICQTGKEPIDQGFLHQNEQSQDQQTNTPGPTCQHTRTNMPKHQQTNRPGPTNLHARTNMPTCQNINKPTRQDQQTYTPGPTCQHTRTNMPTHQDQHANTHGPAKINRKEDLLQNGQN